MRQPLPIDAVLPQLLAALKSSRQAVLQAPPGAGKTTRVPLAMLESGLIKGRILMLEPRRLATRAAAERMAQSLDQPVGKQVGYRIRGEQKTSNQTRIEVVTEGILTRMIQSDAGLTDIGAVIFDEFHERSLQADLGLALCLEIRDALREDLMLLVMSATLDAEPVAELMGGAPVITSMGKAFEVDTRWLPRPLVPFDRRGRGFTRALALLVDQALAETTGDILVFAPGEGEIRQVQSHLQGRLPMETSLHPLFGALDFKAQRAAIAPARRGRKIVLATAIAETSLTIEGVTVVVDGGLARRARFDPASGMSRLVTERVTKAEATQRRGRAGRTAPGTCYRLWTKGEDGGTAAFAPPEIQSADLTALLLELALWGARDPATLPFLSQPNPGAVKEARHLLQDLNALDSTGALTEHGRKMARLPLHPRLAHMLLRGGSDAPLLAALLADRDPLSASRGRPPVDLGLRLQALRHAKSFARDHPFAVNLGTIDRIRAEARRLKPTSASQHSPGVMAALAYPDRVGQRRNGPEPRYILSGGKGAFMDNSDPMASAPLIVVTDLDGDQKEARIRQATEISDADLRAMFSDRIRQIDICRWSSRDQKVQTRQQEVFGALVLSDLHWPKCPPDRISAALLDGVGELGLTVLEFGKSAQLWLARVEWLRRRNADMPDCSDQGLMAALAVWLLPGVKGQRGMAGLKKIELLPLLKSLLSWAQATELDKLAPAHFTAPTGTKLAVDYGGDQPSVSVRLQELFGLTAHPTVGPDHLPLLLNLLSPAQRPVQSTSDLPGFWRTSYRDVRKDLRGRYPKHSWPEDPTTATATRRLKPRKTP